MDNSTCRFKDANINETCLQRNGELLPFEPNSRNPIWRLHCQPQQNTNKTIVGKGRRDATLQKLWRQKAPGRDMRPREVTPEVWRDMPSTMTKTKRPRCTKRRNDLAPTAVLVTAGAPKGTKRGVMSPPEAFDLDAKSVYGVSMPDYTRASPSQPCGSLGLRFQ